MKTIACFAFTCTTINQGFDMADELSVTVDEHMHDFENRRLLVKLGDADRASDALQAKGLPHTGRMMIVPANTWPSEDDLPAPIDPCEIDWDPREDWCLGGPPRISI